MSVSARERGRVSGAGGVVSHAIGVVLGVFLAPLLFLGAVWLS